MSVEVPAFNSFPRVPSPGTISLFEAEASLHAIISNLENPADCALFTDILKEYHNINGRNVKSVFPYKSSDFVARMNVKTFIVPGNQSLVKGLWTSMMDSGLEGMKDFLQKAQPSSNVERVSLVVGFVDTIVTTYYNALKSTLIYTYPHYKMDHQELIEKFAPIRDWSTSWIRAIAWHPTFPKVAIALHDNTIRVFTNGNNIVPMIRSEDQEMVACIAFRPHIHSEMAVGVQKGVLIWEIKSTCSIKPRRNQSKLYTAINHSPVTCVSYSTAGDMLISSSPMDNSIMVWLRLLGGFECLHRLKGGGVPYALWSPDDHRIFSSTPSSIFKFWEVGNNCTPRDWNTSGQPIEAACWSPCSKMLMFACDSYLYIIYLQVSDVDKLLNEPDCKSRIVPIFDLRECLVKSEDEQCQYKIGGRVRQLVWDKTGTRVALFFDDSELIALFRVQPRARSFLDPIGFIRGHTGEYPVAMAFQSQFNDGALLTIAFVTGRVQYFPLLFVNPKAEKNIFHIDNYRLPKPLADIGRSTLSPREMSFVPTSFAEEDNIEAATNGPAFEVDTSQCQSQPLRLFSTSGL